MNKNALIGLVGFGVADYVIVFLSKSAGFLKGMLWNAIFMLFYLLCISFVSGRTTNLFEISTGEFVVGFIAGIITTLGGLSFFKGTQVGNLSVLSPIASSYSVIIILFSILFLSEILLPIQVGSVVLVVVGTILASINLKNFKNLKLVITDRSVPYGLLAMFFWGTSFILIGDMTVKIGWLEIIILTTISGVLFLTILTLYKEKSLSITNYSYKLAALLGILSSMGYLGYSLGVNSTYASIVAPVVAAAPVVTIFLALLFLKEKLAKEQKIGIFLLMLGLVILAV